MERGPMGELQEMLVPLPAPARHLPGFVELTLQDGERDAPGAGPRVLVSVGAIVRMLPWSGGTVLFLTDCTFHRVTESYEDLRALVLPGVPVVIEGEGEGEGGPDLPSVDLIRSGGRVTTAEAAARLTAAVRRMPGLKGEGEGGPPAAELYIAHLVECFRAVAAKLQKALGQRRVSIVFPDTTVMLGEAGI